MQTPRGCYPIPAFMPVGTRGAVKALDSPTSKRSGAEVVLANAYHLMLRPGADVVAALGGCTASLVGTATSSPTSGGFQVHSLRPAVDDDGVTFSSVYDGSSVRLTPESAVEVQGLLGADIQMVLDVCATLPAEPAVLREAVERTAVWAQRARLHHQRIERPSPRVRRSSASSKEAPMSAYWAESAERTVEIGFDGYGIGGLSVGEPRDQMLETMAATVAHLPAGPAPVPDGGGGSDRAPRGGRPRGRPVRLRGPDPDGPARLGADQRRPAQSAQRRHIRPTRTPSTRPAAARTCARWSRGLPPAPAGRWGSRPRGACSASTTCPS